MIKLSNTLDFLLYQGKVIVSNRSLGSVDKGHGEFYTRRKRKAANALGVGPTVLLPILGLSETGHFKS